jgi:protein SCO1
MKIFKRAPLVTAATCCLVALASCGGGGGPLPVTGLAGTVPEQPSQASDFTLTDQHGSTFHMADTRGKVVLMSFFQTHGGDAEAAMVKAVHDLLGANVEHVIFVCVTLDPKRDTPEVMAAYSKKVGLFDVWHFVGGSPKDVKAVWFAYGVAVSADPETPFGSYDLEYYAPACLIDKRGYIRAFMDSEVSSAEIAKNIRVLLALK